MTWFNNEKVYIIGLHLDIVVSAFCSWLREGFKVATKCLRKAPNTMVEALEKAYDYIK